MSKKQKRAREPTQKRSVAFVTNSGWETLECAGYTSLAHNPEITTAFYDDPDSFAGVLLKIPYTYDWETYETDLPVPSIIIEEREKGMIFVLQRNEDFVSTGDED